jgi:hypothetical protein
VSLPLTIPRWCRVPICPSRPGGGVVDASKLFALLSGRLGRLTVEPRLFAIALHSSAGRQTQHLPLSSEGPNRNKLSAKAPLNGSPNLEPIDPPLLAFYQLVAVAYAGISTIIRMWNGYYHSIKLTAHPRRSANA